MFLVILWISNSKTVGYTGGLSKWIYKILKMLWSGVLTVRRQMWNGVRQGKPHGIGLELEDQC